jgi:hypothetical protein
MRRQMAAAAGILLVLAAAATGQTPTLSTWIGGPGNDSLTAAAVLRDGTVILGGAMPGFEPKLGPLARASGFGDGIVLRLAPVSGEIVSALHTRSAVTDIDGDESGLYITGAFGCSKFDSRGRLLWNNDFGGPDARIAAGPGGSALVVAGKTVSVINPRGIVVKSWQVEAVVVLDITCDVSEQLAFVTGYDHRQAADGSTLEVAFVSAFNGDGKQVWRAYGWTAQELAGQGLGGNTRGCCLKMGPGHKLYVLGQACGKESLWTRQGQDIAKKAALVAVDKFQDPAGAEPTTTLAFLGRLDAHSGQSEGGTMLLARAADDKARDLRPMSLAVDEEGRVYVGGWAQENPPISERSFGGAFAGDGAAMVIFDPNFKRLYAAKLCSGATTAVAIGRGCLVAAGSGASNLILTKPIQKTPAGGDSDGWFILFSPPTLPVTPAATETAAPAATPTSAPTPTAVPTPTPTARPAAPAVTASNSGPRSKG